MNDDSYREYFASTDKAVRYDQGEYAPNSYSQLLWDLERPILSRWVADFRKLHRRIDYLDFAAGTGRVASHLEHLVDSSRAIEISASMADRARQRLQRTAVLCKDITAPDADLEGSYDLITAFRFFLNAEPALRSTALAALVLRLRDKDSWLVFNNHGNLWSAKALAWPYHKLRRFRQGWEPKGNYLRHAEVCHLLDAAGLRVVRRVGIGVLGGTVCRLLPHDLALKAERRLASVPGLGRIGQDVLYITALQ